MSLLKSFKKIFSCKKNYYTIYDFFHYDSYRELVNQVYEDKSIFVSKTFNEQTFYFELLKVIKQNINKYVSSSHLSSLNFKIEDTKLDFKTFVIVDEKYKIIINFEISNLKKYMKKRHIPYSKKKSWTYECLIDALKKFFPTEKIDF